MKIKLNQISRNKIRKIRKGFKTNIYQLKDWGLNLI